MSKPFVVRDRFYREDNHTAITTHSYVQSLHTLVHQHAFLGVVERL